MFAPGLTVIGPYAKRMRLHSENVGNVQWVSFSCGAPKPREGSSAEAGAERSPSDMTTARAIRAARHPWRRVTNTVSTVASLIYVETLDSRRSMRGRARTPRFGGPQRCRSGDRVSHLLHRR